MCAVPIHLVAVFFGGEVFEHPGVTGKLLVAERAYKKKVCRVVCDYPIDALPVTPPVLLADVAECIGVFCSPAIHPESCILNCSVHSTGPGRHHVSNGLVSNASNNLVPNDLTSKSLASTSLGSHCDHTMCVFSK